MEPYSQPQSTSFNSADVETVSEKGGWIDILTSTLAIVAIKKGLEWEAEITKIPSIDPIDPSYL